jgi:hypothetical protein
MPNEKYCINCHWSKLIGNFNTASSFICCEPRFMYTEKSPVTGNYEPIVTITCIEARATERYCSKEGKWFMSIAEWLAKLQKEDPASATKRLSKITVDDL